MNEKEIREEALKRYEKGETPKEICQNFHKSKSWFLKWLNRSRCDGQEWSKDLSRRPHQTRKKISKDIEQAIIDTRK